MTTPNTESEAEPKVVFRPGKKRKAYRQRVEGELDEKIATFDDETAAGPPTSNPIPDTEEEDALSVVEALKLRNSRKHKLGGVGFRAGQSSNSNNSGTLDSNIDQSLVFQDGTGAQSGTDIISGMNTRFAPQTGLVGEIVNKHMEEYVESELARRKRHAAEASARQDEQVNNETYMSGIPPDTGTAGAVPQVVDSQRVLQGKLLEIDLGDESRARNIEMTERARRRLQGQIDEEDEDSTDGRNRKVRLGRDGKPWRPRNRRTSDDIKRDQLVEAFLSENKLDMYDVPSERTAATAAAEEEDECAADDRIAEKFRREFMDAMAQRNRRRRPATNAKQTVKSRDDILRGPKLGGSRNARAAARDVLLKEQQAKRR